MELDGNVFGWLDIVTWSTFISAWGMGLHGPFGTRAKEALVTLLLSLTSWSLEEAPGRIGEKVVSPSRELGEADINSNFCPFMC